MKLFLKSFGVVFLFSLFVSGCSGPQGSVMQRLDESEILTYPDGRPSAKLRLPAQDLGVVLRYGEALDGCDLSGAREAIINEDNGQYYLFYDGQGAEGWRTCLAVSNDLQNWTRKGTVLESGSPDSKDAKSASSPWVIRDGDEWEMFYLGTPNATPDADLIPMFPYYTMKARSKSLEGPWEKQYDVTPFVPKEGTYYSATASPGYIVRNGDEYLQFFSASSVVDGKTLRTLGIARTKDLDGSWIIDDQPIFPQNEQVENSSLYFEGNTWFLFTNHVGVDEYEYTDAIWVYWSDDLNHWNPENKAVVLDAENSTWAKGAIGMPSVIKLDDKLAILYDGVEGTGTSHMQRNIGLAVLPLPLKK